MARCNDCGADAPCATCKCGATVCADCLAAYHLGALRLGCAAYAGKLLVESIRSDEKKLDEDAVAEQLGKAVRKRSD